MEKFFVSRKILKFNFMSERSKSSKSRAVQSLKSYNKPGNKEDMLSRTRSKKSSGTSKSSEKYCSNTGEVCSRRASTSDKHRARSRSRSHLLRTSSDGRCDSRVSLADRALRARAGERSSSRSRDESVHRPSGLGRVSPSAIPAESRPVRPIVSEENELLESVEQAPQWVKYMIAFQQQSEQRLQNLESAVKKAGSTYVSPNQDKMVHKFTKKLYQEQYDFNMSLYRALENAIKIENREERDADLLTGIDMTEKRKRLQPNAMLQPGDINYCDNEHDLDLECLFSCNVELFEQPDLAVGNDQRDSILESPSSNMTNEYTPNMKGRLKENISFWEEIGASSWVLSILKDGYALPFISEADPKIFQNNVSALRNKEFLTNEILDLLNSGRVREVSQNEIEVLNPPKVADNGQKLRLVSDCRHINSFLRVPRFKCDDIRTIRYQGFIRGWRLFLQVQH